MGAEEIRAAHDVLDRAGPTMEISDAATVLGIHRSHAYQLIHRGQWPTPVLRLGRKMLIPTADLRQTLGLPAERDDHREPVAS